VARPLPPGCRPGEMCPFAASLSECWEPLVAVDAAAAHLSIAPKKLTEYRRNREA
jgi:hypothetical protein